MTSIYESSQGRLSEILGGSWVVISGVISKVPVITTLFRGLVTPLITN